MHRYLFFFTISSTGVEDLAPAYLTCSLSEQWLGECTDASCCTVSIGSTSTDIFDGLWPKGKDGRANTGSHGRCGSKATSLQTTRGVLYSSSYCMTDHIAVERICIACAPNQQSIVWIMSDGPTRDKRPIRFLKPIMHVLRGISDRPMWDKRISETHHARGLLLCLHIIFLSLFFPSFSLCGILLFYSYFEVTASIFARHMLADSIQTYKVGAFFAFRFSYSFLSFFFSFHFPTFFR